MELVLSVAATLLAKSSETGDFPGYRGLFDGEETFRRVVDLSVSVLRAPVRQR